MDMVIRQSKEMETFGKNDLSMFMPETKVKEEDLYLFETDRILEEELKGVANVLFENLRGYNNQYDQLYSRVKYHKLLDRLVLSDITKILNAAGQDPELAETYLFYSDGNTRRLEHLITHSISVAKFNGLAKVDSTVIKQTSKMLMA
ncbi:hypothetical protein IJ182_04925 [bacterium]|nr:hypothetical protein [bacterium]